MAKRIDTQARIEKVRLQQMLSHPSNPDSGYESLYIISGSSHGGLFVKDSAGRQIGPFITGTSSVISTGYEYSYVECSGTVSITATSEGAADTVVTSSSVTYDGTTRLCIEFFAPRAKPDNGAAGRLIVFVLLEDSTVLGQISLLRTPAAAFDDKTVLSRRFRTPSAGSHTYTIKAWVSAGTGSIEAGGGGAGTDVPAYIRITKA